MSAAIKSAAANIQGTALFLVIFGAIVCGAGCWHNWGELKTAGATIIGAGVQAITSQVRHALGETSGESPN